MKKYIILIVALFVSFTSCKDYLKEQVVTTLTQDYYKTTEGLESLCRGSYKILRYKGDYNQGEYLFGSGSDVEVFCWANADRIEIGSYAADAWGPDATGTRTTPFVANLVGGVTTSSKYTEGSYPSIGACNTFLKYYDALSDKDKASLLIRKGEILFLRAYSYYLVTNVVGAVPLITVPAEGMPKNFYYAKESLENIYKLLIKNMREAVTILPATTLELGRITKPAAAHFLAKLYLNRAQASGWSGSVDYLKMLYKGNVSTDLDSAIFYSTLTIDQMKGATTAGGLAPDFGSLWLNDGTLSRDNVKEILLSAQYEPTQTYNGRYGDASAVSLTHVYNSNHTTANAGILRDINYGRPYATLMPSDWGYDMFTDRANDSRYYKSFLTSYNVTDITGKGKPWDPQSAYYYNLKLKTASEATVVASATGRMINGNIGLAYVENSKDQPLDSLWVMGHPYVMNTRWLVGSPNNLGYVDYLKSVKNPSKDSINAKGFKIVTGFKPGAAVEGNNPVVTDYKAQGRKIYYRISGTDGSAYGIDRGINPAQWYMGANKWLDKTRGQGTNANGSQSFDTPIFRLAETYLIRAEAYGRKSGGTSQLAIDDINVLRKRAAYHSGEKRSPILVTAEPAVLTGTLAVPTAEKVAPYIVANDSYNAIKVDGTEWQTGSERSLKENYPPTSSSDLDRFIHFIYNERARELIFELTNTEDLHNAGILYDRVYYRDMLGAPTSSTGTVNFPFPVDDLGGSGYVGAKGVGKGNFQKYHTFKCWPTSVLELLTDEKGNALDAAAKAAFQNPGY